MAINPALLQGLADAIAGGALAGLSKEAGSDFFSPFIQAQQSRIARETRAEERAEDKELRTKERAEDKAFATSERVMSQIFQAQQNALDRQDREARAGYQLFVDGISAFNAAVLADPSAYPVEAVDARIAQYQAQLAELPPAQREAGAAQIEQSVSTIGRARREQKRGVVLSGAAKGNFMGVDNLDLKHPDDAAVLAEVTGPDSLPGRVYGAAQEVLRNGGELPSDLESIVSPEGNLTSRSGEWQGVMGSHLTTLAGYDPKTFHALSAKAITARRIPDVQRKLNLSLEPRGISLKEGDIAVVEGPDGKFAIDLTSEATDRIIQGIQGEIMGATDTTTLSSIASWANQLRSDSALPLTGVVTNITKSVDDRYKYLADNAASIPVTAQTQVPDVSLDSTLGNIDDFNMSMSRQAVPSVPTSFFDLPSSPGVGSLRGGIVSGSGPVQTEFAQGRLKDERRGTLVTPDYLQSLALVGWTAGDPELLAQRAIALKNQLEKEAENPYTSPERKSDLESEIMLLQAKAARIEADRVARAKIGGWVETWAANPEALITSTLNDTIKADLTGRDFSLRGTEVFGLDLENSDDVVDASQALVKMMASNASGLAGVVTAQAGEKTAVLKSLQSLEASFDAKVDDLSPVVEGLLVHFTPQEVLAELRVPVSGNSVTFNGGTTKFKRKIKDMTSDEIAAYAALVYIAR